MIIGRYLALAGLAFSLGACSILPKSSPVQVYLLPPGSAQAASATPLPQSLRIALPQASLILDSTRIAVSPEGTRLNSYKDARWGDAAPALLRDHLVRAFQDSGRFAAVSSDEQHLKVDLELQGSLSAFQAEYRDGHPEVLIRYQAHLSNAGNQRILASRAFEVRQASADTRLESVVAAFGQASDLLAAQLIAWSAEQASHQP